MKHITKAAASLLVCLTLLALPSQAGAASRAGAGAYTVAAGDTLWKIAAASHVGVSELIAANPRLSNPDLIYPGQTVVIPQADTAVSSYEAQVVRLVNQARSQNGLPPLTEDWELSRVARYKSQDMKDRGYFSHTSPTYGTPFQMIRAFGLTYRYAGENIAMGYATPQAVMEGWMNSSGHRANILSPNFTKIGVGYVAKGNYWTQMFLG